MKIRQVRRDNLKALAQKYGGASSLAKKVGMTKSWLSQLIGKNPDREVGDQAARNIEKTLGLSEGWLDTTHSGGGINQEILMEAVLLVHEVLAEEKVDVSPQKIARLVAAIYSRLEAGSVSRMTVRELVALAS
jgi:hypothetical protein